ncbi:hypothetical protein ACS0TY_013799 [Phlomoides rotata]
MEDCVISLFIRLDDHCFPDPLDALRYIIGCLASRKYCFLTYIRTNRFFLNVESTTSCSATSFLRKKPSQSSLAPDVIAAMSLNLDALTCSWDPV